MIQLELLIQNHWVTQPFQTRPPISIHPKKRSMSGIAQWLFLLGLFVSSAFFEPSWKNLTPLFSLYPRYNWPNYPLQFPTFGPSNDKPSNPRWNCMCLTLTSSSQPKNGTRLPTMSQKTSPTRSKVYLGLHSCSIRYCGSLGTIFRIFLNQGTIGCTRESVPMVFIVFSRDSWGLKP